MKLLDLIFRATTGEEYQVCEFDFTDIEIENALKKIREISPSATELNKLYEFYDLHFTSQSTLLLDGTAHISLEKNYVLENNGDFLEFEAKWNNINSSKSKLLGLFGSFENKDTEYIGYFNENTIHVKADDSEVMAFDNISVNHTKLNKYKFLVEGMNLSLYINDVLSSRTILAAPLSINSIGNCYGADLVEASIKYVNIKSSSNQLYTNDLHNDTRFIQKNTKEILTKRELNFNPIKDELLIKYNGTDAVTILKPQVNKNFIAYVFKKTNVLNSEYWGLKNTYLSDRYFNLSTEITNDSDWETAIKIEGADTSIGGENGNETLKDYKCFIDGVKVDLSAAFETTCKRLEFIQKSDLFAPAPLLNEGDKIASTSKKWVFNIHCENQFSQKVNWTSQASIENSFLFMIPINRLKNEEQISHTFCVSDEYDEVDIKKSNHGNPKYTGYSFDGDVRIWGEVFSAKVDVLKGWRPTSIYNTSPLTDNKMNFDFTGTYNALENEEIEIKVNFDIQTGGR